MVSTGVPFNLQTHDSKTTGSIQPRYVFSEVGYLMRRLGEVRFPVPSVSNFCSDEISV